MGNVNDFSNKAISAPGTLLPGVAWQEVKEQVIRRY